MVLDWADEAVKSMARVIRECPPNESLTAAVVRAMKEDMERFDDVPDDIVMFLPRFVDLIDSRPRSGRRGSKCTTGSSPSSPRRWQRGPRSTRAIPSR